MVTIKEKGINFVVVAVFKDFRNAVFVFILVFIIMSIIMSFLTEPDIFKVRPITCIKNTSILI